MKNKKSRRKKKLRAHTKLRAQQRYGLTINNETIKQMVRDIQQNKAAFLKRISSRVTKWRVKAKGQGIIVYYDSERQAIITCL